MRLTNLKMLHNLRGAPSAISRFAYGTDRLITKLGVGMRFTTSQSFRIKMRTVGVSLSRSIFSHHIPAIIDYRAEKKMFRVDARRIIAVMQNKQRTRIMCGSDKVCNTRGGKSFAAQLEITITPRAASLFRPRPTLGIAVAFVSSMKTVDFWLGQFGDKIMFGHAAFVTSKVVLARLVRMFEHSFEPFSIIPQGTAW